MQLNPIVVEVYPEYYEEYLDKLGRDERKYLNETIRATHYFLIFSGEPIGGFAIERSADNEGCILTGVFNCSDVANIIIPTVSNYLDTHYKGVKFTIYVIGDKLKEIWEAVGFKEYIALEYTTELENSFWSPHDERPNTIYIMTKEI